MSSKNSICRVCRRSQDDTAPSFVSLFFKEQAEDAVESSIASMLEFVGSISVSAKETNMPQKICVECLDQLRISYNFRKLCMESDGLLRKQNKQAVATTSENGSSSFKQQQISGNKHHAVYLHDYDPSFYQLVLDRYYYMELFFTARRCCGCRQAFASSDELQVHSSSVHRKNQLGVAAHQCPICFSRFPYEDALHYHRQAKQSNVFCCRECNLMFEKKHSLFSHLRTEHRRAEFELEKELYAEEEDQPMGHSIFDPDPEPNLVVSNVQSLAESNADPYLAGYCELSPDLRLCDLRPSQYRFTERTDRFSIIEFTWHRCCACNHMFQNEGDLEVHCTEEHRLRYNPTATIYMQSKPFMCQHCWRRFKKKSLLGLHQKFNRKKVYTCNTCFHIFFGGPAYEKHLPACYPPGVNPVQLSSTYADEAAYVGHPMMKEEPEDDDDDADVYILND